MDRELLQDSDGVNESFWDGLGVEFEAKYFLEGIWGCGGSRTIETVGLKWWSRELLGRTWRRV